MLLSIDWPNLVEQEYCSWFSDNTKNRRCLHVSELNTSLGLTGKEIFIDEMPPCFLVGQIDKAKTMLIGLNPKYKCKNKDKEIQAIKDLGGWRNAYLTFFNWFLKRGLSSQYYSRFAVFLAGYQGVSPYPKLPEKRYELLGKYLINADLVPYHSISFRHSAELLSNEKVLVDSYVENMKELILIAKKLKVIFLNGAIFKDLLESLNVTETKTRKFDTNKRLGRKLLVHIGEMQISGKRIKTVRFDSFLTSRNLAATNECLFEMGKKLTKL
jgi:hypothetical protein